jgi:hypothetical protein
MRADVNDAQHILGGKHFSVVPFCFPVIGEVEGDENMAWHMAGEPIECPCEGAKTVKTEYCIRPITGVSVVDPGVFISYEVGIQWSAILSGARASCSNIVRRGELFAVLICRVEKAPFFPKYYHFPKKNFCTFELVA